LCGMAWNCQQLGWTAVPEAGMADALESLCDKRFGLPVNFRMASSARSPQQRAEHVGKSSRRQLRVSAIMIFIPQRDFVAMS
jgi:hypothetical protein